MSLTAIPLQFEKYLQNQISVGNGPDMNEMIFAYIPDLDLTQPIDRSQGLPDVSLWVHQQDIDQVGKLGDNALVYSVVIPGSVDAFTFNAIYLRDKNVPNSCGMVVHKADETKENGMASTKSLMQQYTGAAQIAGIDVDAATWQIDYQARLLGIEDDMRLANVDTYGHAAFVDGFEVVQQADPTKYAISPGVAYVGGLRAVLDDEIIQTINTKPNGLYLDVVRMGTALSQWQNVVTVRLSPVEMSDYVDGSNQQHFVAKLAGINADGTIADWRVKGGLGEHEAASDPHPQYVRSENAQFLPYDPTRLYSVGEVCYTKDENGKVSFWEWYSNVESLAGKDPSDTINRQTGWTDETKPFYWTPFKKSRSGSTKWPWMSMTFPEGTLNVIGNSVPTAVFWRLAEALPEFVNENTGMIDFPETGGEFFRVLDQGRGIDIGRAFNSSQLSQNLSHNHNWYQGAAPVGNVAGTTASAGDSGSIQIPTDSEGGSEARPRNLAFPILVEV
ncbi:phage tail-collar fiber domain-containing protein [Vibrio fluvialis]|uniref:phage tail-collar fiber domain-containing protein n=1 Tax=Vibrio fluvialis TaxID=676 RepID=UPI002B261A43|nr:phage tail protein [Vibrio fluvialis]WPK51854.1 phage tail protein [Vibrio fluvialis]